MTVAELRTALEALPADADAWTVVLSRDSEGNAFSPLREVECGFYEVETARQGQFFTADEAAAAGMPAPEVWRADAQGALCLWPVR